MKWLKKVQGGGKGLWAAVLTLAVAVSLYALFSGETGGTQTERRLSQVLSAIEGAGRVEVAVFYEESNSASLFGGAQSQAPTGCVVVAQGAGDIKVRLLLIRAARTLLGLTESQVDVFCMAREVGTQ